MIIEGGIFEKIDLNTQIYNPLFDHIHKKNSLYYDMEQYLSIKRALKPSIPHLAIPIPIQVSNLPSIPIALTPFQRYKFKLNAFQSAVEEKQKTNSQKNINIKIQSSPLYPMNHREITSLQIEQYKRRLIGSYSSYYYNKFELDKVRDFNSKGKKKLIDDKMNITQKKDIYIKSVKMPNKASNLLSLSINKRKPFDKTALLFRVQNNN